MASRRLALLFALALSVLVGHAVQDEGTARPVRPGGTNYVGSGVSCVDDTTRTTCTMSVASGSIGTAEITDGSVALADVNTAATLAGNPALAAGQCYWALTGVICEGATANTAELLLEPADPLADVTVTIPAAPITVSGVLNKTTTTVQTCSTSTIFDLYRVTVPANLLGTTGLINVVITGDWLQNQASTTSWTFTVLYGGTTMFAGTSALIGQDADRAPFVLNLTFASAGATNSQVITGSMATSSRGTPTTGIGTITTSATAMSLVGALAGTAAEDSTTALDLAVRVTHSVNDAATCTRLRTAVSSLL